MLTIEEEWELSRSCRPKPWEYFDGTEMIVSLGNYIYFLNDAFYFSDETEQFTGPYKTASWATTMMHVYCATVLAPRNREEE